MFRHLRDCINEGIPYLYRLPYLLVSEIAIASPHDMDAPHMDDHSEEIGEEGIDGNMITS